MRILILAMVLAMVPVAHGAESFLESANEVEIMRMQGEMEMQKTEMDIKMQELRDQQSTMEWTMRQQEFKKQRRDMDKGFSEADDY